MLYGRDAERARINALIETARGSRSGALVIRGEPGIGKTALLEDARERASDLAVLVARGVESESELPFAALHQLLRPALGQLDRIPARQADALRSALGLSEAAGEERFLVFAACLSLLSEIAEQRPLLCLVDDAQWLDAASADALQFVVRRLDAEGIVMLFAVREGTGLSFEPADVPSLSLAGIDDEAAAELLARGSGVDAAPDVRALLVARTQGNALALLELPSVLTRGQLSGDEPLPDTLPMTRQLESVFLGRVRGLPVEAQHLLLVAAADDSEDAALVARASDGGDGLDAVERAGLVSVDGARLVFRHPLVRSAVYFSATSTERRAAHRALANALADDAEQADRRAWHLAASALERDETVVQALLDAARRAQSRGGFAAAASAFERAAELSSDDTARGLLLVDAARCASIACADVRATAIARRAEHLVQEPLQRAELTQVLAVAEIRQGRPANALPALLEAACALRASAPAKVLSMLLDVTWAASETVDPESQRQAGEIAATIETSGDDDGSTNIVRLLTGLGAVAAGDLESAVTPLRHVEAWAGDADDPRHVVWAAIAAFTLGDEDRAAVLFGRTASLARTSGSIGLLAPTLCLLGLQQLVAQRFDQAAAAGLEALQFARDLGAVNLEPLPLYVLSFVAAIRGDDETARARAGAAIERATEHGMPLGAARPLWSLALVDLGSGRWKEALERFEAMASLRRGIGSALVMRATPDHVEAAVRARRPDLAQAALEFLEARVARAAPPWARPILAACRAQLAEGDAATEHFEEALRLSAAARPFDLARIQLLYGEHLRRGRRRVDARVHLRAALETFERMRAEPWIERARAELRASGETARKRDPSTLGDLTAQELQIARFVAGGLSNKEVAALLYLSPRTIDYHLRHVFVKLAITSRTQLARLVPASDDAPAVAIPALAGS